MKGKFKQILSFIIIILLILENNLSFATQYEDISVNENEMYEDLQGSTFATVNNSTDSWEEVYISYGTTTNISGNTNVFIKGGDYPYKFAVFGDNTGYVRYNKAIKSLNENNEIYYDLILEPIRLKNIISPLFSYEPKDNVQMSENLKYAPCIFVKEQEDSDGDKIAHRCIGLNLKVVKHNTDISVSVKAILGFSDLDNQEYIILPKNNIAETIHIGEQLEIYDFNANINSSANSIPKKIYNILGTEYNGFQFIGKKNSSNTNPNEQYNTNAFLVKASIPTEGITIFYGDKSSYGRCTYLAFDEMKDYLEETGFTYTIKFNTNGGDGNFTDIIQFGGDSNVVMGDISATLPTKTGYTFYGWSASQELNNKRISYHSIDGSVQTSSSWTYKNYCDNTDGDATNKTLTLYAQWKPNQSTLKINPNGGTWNNTTNISEYTKGYAETLNIPIPVRENYTFLGWERTNIYGLITSLTTNATYTFGVTANVTDTLTATWKPNKTDYTVKHYLMNTDGVNYTLVDSDRYEALIGSTVTPPTKSYTGFTTPASQSGVVEADGSLEIKYYYTRHKSTLRIEPNNGYWML